MEKQIILYNLAKGVTEEKYHEYVLKEKGPLLESLSTVQKYELLKVVHSESGKIPYNYIGILDVSSLEQFGQKDAPTPKFQGFLQKWGPMATDVLMLAGIKIY